MNRFSWLVLLLFLLLPAASAQNNPEPQLQPRPAEPATAPSTPAPSGPDRRITIEVQVNDKSGASIRGLQREDFTILDDKQPQNILSFQAVDSAAAAATNDPPVEVVLVVDAVNTSFQAVSQGRDEIKRFLLQNGGKLALPVSLILFTDAGPKVQNDSSRDGNALAAEYQQLETGLRSIGRSQGFYGASERFSLSLKTINSLAAYEADRPGRKLMIWLSPGWPMLSGPNIELSNKEQQEIFKSIVAASTNLRLADVTLYSIDPLGMTDAGGIRTMYYKEFLKGVPSYSHALPGDLGLQVLAVQTGGRVFSSTNDLTSAIADCAADGNAFYILSFDSPRADQANEYHSLAVKVDKPGVMARSRTGYYAQP